IRCENLEDMTFQNESFDLFITQDVFEHVMEPKKAFKEIERVLKPGGALLYTQFLLYLFLLFVKSLGVYDTK
ncbi:class I SAM-dependent methyltransferase, partial [Bacillus sp. D-CC]